LRAKAETLDIETRRAIFHLLRLWEQYSSTVGEEGRLCLLHQNMAAGEDAAAFLSRLGLGTDDGMTLTLSAAGLAIAQDETLNEPL
jgi:hypothetical protein